MPAFTSVISFKPPNSPVCGNPESLHLWMRKMRLEEAMYLLRATQLRGLEPSLAAPETLSVPSTTVSAGQGGAVRGAPELAEDVTVTGHPF